MLLPIPRKLHRLPGSLPIESGKLLILDSRDPQALLNAARRLQRTLEEHCGVHWEIAAGNTLPPAFIGFHLHVPGQSNISSQGYRLSITREGIQAEASDPAGAFYAVCTLIQVIEQYPAALPCMEIEDWADFPVRGVLLDISRDKIPSMETLYNLVDMLAGWKVNQLQLYTEHTFAYRRHPVIWAEASPMTGEEILALDQFCRERFIELVPNQNSFGHFTRWLKHPEYAPLAETHDRFMAPWGQQVEGPFSLCPLDPMSLQLLREMYDELLPHFSSRMFNVGCDETFDLGVGRSQAECQARGVERVYLGFLLKIHHEVSQRGHTMQFWGDIILHAPKLIRELPRDIIALNWGYEASHPFKEQGTQFEKAGIPYYVCPGTSSWNSIAGRTDNALGNLRNAAGNGLKHGAIGYLNTDWGDFGHWQPPPISYIGLAAGAAYGWALEANHSIDISRTVSLHAFGDGSGKLGKAAFDMGNVYHAAGQEPENSSALFWLLMTPLKEMRASRHLLPKEALTDSLAAIGQAASLLSPDLSIRVDRKLLYREMSLAAGLLRHACQRGLYLHQPEKKAAKALHDEAQALLEEFQYVWLLRNRPGGLRDSIIRLEEMVKENETDL